MLLKLASVPIQIISLFISFGRTNRSADFYSDSAHSYNKVFSTCWFIFSSLNRSPWPILPILPPWVKVLLLTRLMHQRKNMALATDSSYLFQLKIIFPSRSELLWEQMHSQPTNGLLLPLSSYEIIHILILNSWAIVELCALRVAVVVWEMYKSNKIRFTYRGR